MLIGVFLVVERLRPAQRRPLFARGYRQDLIYTVLNATLVAPLVVALTLSFSEVLHRSLPWLVLSRLPAFPRWGVIALIFVAMDGLNWFAHLSNHRVQMLWRFHELHHSQEDMSVLTVFRTHPLIHVSYLDRPPPGHRARRERHAVDDAARRLRRGGRVRALQHEPRLRPASGAIFVSPNYHRIHHKMDGPQDVNLGFALTIWDQLTHRAILPTPETIRMDTGLRGRPLVVEQASSRPRHVRVFLAQLVAPFRPMPDRRPCPRCGARRRPSPRRRSPPCG